MRKSQRLTPLEYEDEVNNLRVKLGMTVKALWEEAQRNVHDLQEAYYQQIAELAARVQ